MGFSGLCLAGIWLFVGFGNRYYPTQRMIVLGLAGSLPVVIGLVRTRRVDVQVVDTGLRIANRWRTLEVAWSDVRGVGWFVVPTLGAGTDEFSLPMVVSKRSRFPTFIWVSDLTMARTEGIGQEVVRDRLESLVVGAGSVYWPRVPDIPTFALSVIWAIVLAGVGFIGAVAMVVAGSS